MTLVLFALAQSVFSHTGCAYGKYSKYKTPGGAVHVEDAIDVCGGQYGFTVTGWGAGWTGDQSGCGYCPQGGLAEGLELCTEKKAYPDFEDVKTNSEHYCFRDTDGNIIKTKEQHDKASLKEGCKDRGEICLAKTGKAYVFVCIPGYIWIGKAGIVEETERKESLLGCKGDSAIIHGFGKCIERPTAKPLVAAGNANFDVTVKDKYEAYDTMTVKCKSGKFFSAKTFGQSFLTEVKFKLVLVGEEEVGWRYVDNVDLEITDDIVENFCTDEQGCMKKGMANYNKAATLDGGKCIICDSTNSDTVCKPLDKVCENGVCIPQSLTAQQKMPFGVSSSVFFIFCVIALILLAACCFFVGKRYIAGKDTTSAESNLSFGAGSGKTGTRRPAE